MKNNLELILLVGNWVVVAIQAFTIFLFCMIIYAVLVYFLENKRK